MTELAPEYIAAVSVQLGSVSAFLGGFTATLLVALLALRSSDRITGVAVGFCVVSAVSFIIAVVAASTLYAAAQPQAPAMMAQGPKDLARVLMTVGFLLGVVTLLGAIGMSGWLRSRRMGLLTGAAAVAGLVLVLSMSVVVG